MKTKIIILAAGKGTRMGSELPKVLVPLHGRPMMDYLLAAVRASGAEDRPIVVVSPDNRDLIAQTLAAYDFEIAIQDQQLGTGHAVACARSYLDRDVDNVLVLYGDQPFLRAESIKTFCELTPTALTIMSTILPSFDGWYHNFYHLGRIARDSNGHVRAIVEYKDANDEEKAITEINLGFMCFNKQWLLDNIDKLNANNKAHEFYLTSLVDIARNQGFSIDCLPIDSREAMGINSREELSIAEGLATKE